MKKISLLLLALGNVIIVISQNNTDYQRLKNNGELPEAVYIPSSEKFEKSISNIDETLRRSEQKTQEQYYLESSFSIDDMMRSGIVLYNAEYNAYLEKIADILLKDNPELRSKVHFYLLRSPVVNAFAAGEGNIFISMGLIAMLDDESQLAFVMGHEIGHIAKQHGLDFYMKAKSIDRSGTDKKIMKNASFNESMISKNLYSQKLESEADKFGVETILKTDYTTNSLNGVLDVLKYAYLPYENAKFTKDFFETDNYVISDNLILDSVQEITGEAEMPDEKESLKSTHPSIGERRAAIGKYLDSTTTDTKAYVLVSQQNFESLRNVARYELPMFYLHNQYYQDAIYASYLSLQKDSGNFYLEKIISKSLVYLAKFRNDKSEETYAEAAKFHDYEGEQEQIYYMLQNMSNAELSVLALEYTYKTHLQNPKDKELIPLCKTMVEDLSEYYFEDDNEFKKNSTITRDSLQAQANRNVVRVDPNKTTKKKTTTSTTKKVITKKTTSKKSTNKTLETYSHLLYAFNDYWDDKEFQNLWDDHFEEKRKNEEIQSGRSVRIKYNNRNKDIDKIVVMNPFYLRVDARKENAIEYVSSEEGEIKYIDILKENAKLVDVDLEIIEPLLMNQSDANEFNDMTSLDDWFSEQLDFGSFQLPGFNQNEIDSIADKYGTDYFLWTGILSLQDKNNILTPVVYMLCSPFFAPLLPYGIYELFSPEYEFFYLAVLYNVKTYEPQVLKYLFLENNDTRAVLNSQTYDMLHNIAGKSKN